MSSRIARIAGALTVVCALAAGCSDQDTPSVQAQVADAKSVPCPDCTPGELVYLATMARSLKQDPSTMPTDTQKNLLAGATLACDTFAAGKGQSEVLASLPNDGTELQAALNNMVMVAAGNYVCPDDSGMGK